MVVVDDDKRIVFYTTFTGSDYSTSMVKVMTCDPEVDEWS